MESVGEYKSQEEVAMEQLQKTSKNEEEGQKTSKNEEEVQWKDEYTDTDLLSLLDIVVDCNVEIASRNAACVNLETFISRFWSPPHPAEISNRSLVREKILTSINKVSRDLRVQLGKSLEIILQADFPDHWPTLLQWVKDNLHNVHDEQINGAVFVLRMLSRLFMSDIEKAVPILEETFPHLLEIFNRLVHTANPSIAVADSVMLICKIFRDALINLSSLNSWDERSFNDWIVLLLNILERPVPLDGQPRKWWKAKNTILKTLFQFYHHSSEKKVIGHSEEPFSQKYAGKILESHLKLLNAIRIGGCLPEKVINLTMQHLCASVSSDNSMYTAVQKKLDVLLSEIVLPLMYFNDTEKKHEDQYLRMEEAQFNSLGSKKRPRTAAMDFVKLLIWDLQTRQKFMLPIKKAFKSYDDAPPYFKPYEQKDGALFAIAGISDTLKKDESYSSELEHMLVHHIFPEFESPMGHLRAKAAQVVGKYANIKFSDRNIFLKGLHNVINGMRDQELAVRFESVTALRSFLWESKGEVDISTIDFAEISPFLSFILDVLFKELLEGESDVFKDVLVSILEKLVCKFGDEMNSCAFKSCQKLADAFWKCTKPSEDPTRYLRAIISVLKSIRKYPNIFLHIEQTLLPIIRLSLTSNEKALNLAGVNSILEIVSLVTRYTPEISMEMWSLWPSIIEAIIEIFSHSRDKMPSVVIPLDNYIARSTKQFLTCEEPNYQKTLLETISSIMDGANWEDDVYCMAVTQLIQGIFRNCRGYGDVLVEPYIRMTAHCLVLRTRKSSVQIHLSAVIADALYYDASLTLDVLKKENVMTEVLEMWFTIIQDKSSNGKQVDVVRIGQKKIWCLGLISLLPLKVEQLERVFRSTVDLLLEYKDGLDGITDKQLASPSTFDIDVDPLVYYLDIVEAWDVSDTENYRGIVRNYQTQANLVNQHVLLRMDKIEEEKKAKDKSVQPFASWFW